jgi:hypothetical protein
MSDRRSPDPEERLEGAETRPYGGTSYYTQRVDPSEVDSLHREAITT